MYTVIIDPPPAYSGDAHENDDNFGQPLMLGAHLPTDADETV